MFKKIASEWKNKGAPERAWMIGGVLMLGAAVVGVFLPIVPQAPFAIISAYCFSKGSPALHRKVRHNKFFGKPVRDWEDHRIVRPKTKIFSTIFMICGAVIGHIKLTGYWPYALDAVFLASIIFVLSRKSKSLLSWT